MSVSWPHRCSTYLDGLATPDKKSVSNENPFLPSAVVPVIVDFFPLQTDSLSPPTRDLIGPHILPRSTSGQANSFHKAI